MKTLRNILIGLLVVMMLDACQAPPAPAATPTADPAIATLQAQADQVAANKAVMEKFLELFTSGAWDEFDQVIATDCVLHYPGGVDVVGLDAMVAGWGEFFPKLKDLTFTSQGEVAEGDLMMEFITFEATYEGDYMGQQIDGVPIKYNQVEMQRYKDGKIVEWWVENDRLWMAEQLGAYQPSPTPDPAIATLKADADQVAANKAVMGKFLELFTSGAWDEFDQVIATDCVLHYPGGVDVVGLDAMVAGWGEFFPKLKDLTFTSQGEVAEGDLMMEFITFEATYEGDYMGQQIDGVPIKYNQVEMQRYKDGKIVEWWVENDRLWMAEQLGMELVPTEPAAQAPSFPTGTFILGNLGFVFRDNGYFTMLMDEKPYVRGVYRIQGNEIRWKKDSSCDARGAGEATYTWTYEDGVLTFHLKGKDRCTFRVQILDNRSWKEQ